MRLAADYDSGPRGAVVVELAMVLPILIFMFLAVVDLGSLLRDHQVLQTAAREGARFSALPGNQESSSQNPAAIEAAIKQQVIAYLAADGISISSENVTVDQESRLSVRGVNVPGSGSRVEVTVETPVLTPFAPILPTVVTLRGVAVFRNFY